MLVGFDHSAQVRGAEPGRRGEKHHIHIAVDELLKRIQPDKLFGLIHCDFGGGLIALLFAQSVQAGINAILRNICHGGERGVIVRMERLTGGPCAPATAADEPHLNGLAGGSAFEQCRSTGQ